MDTSLDGICQGQRAPSLNMTRDGARGDRLPTSGRGVPVPRADVTTEMFRYAPSGDPEEVIIYCGSCNKRLFDIHPIRGERVRLDVDSFFLRLERYCPRCHRIMTTSVTASPGYPHPDTPAGLWRCECGGPLARIDPVRGRVTVRCRCGTDARVTALDAVHAADEAFLLAGSLPS